MARSQGNRGGRPLAATPFQIDRIRRLRASGFSLRAIAKTTGVSFQTVQHHREGFKVNQRKILKNLVGQPVVFPTFGQRFPVIYADPVARDMAAYRVPSGVITKMLTTPGTEMAWLKAADVEGWATVYAAEGAAQ